jgi:hypothetical protein
LDEILCGGGSSNRKVFRREESFQGNFSTGNFQGKNNPKFLLFLRLINFTSREYVPGKLSGEVFTRQGISWRDFSGAEFFHAEKFVRKRGGKVMISSMI